MKTSKVKLLVSICVFTLTSLTQIIAQTINSAKVVAIMSIGQKDVAFVNDIETGSYYKSVAFERGLLLVDESVTLDINDKTEKGAKIIKENIGVEILCFLERGNKSTTCDSFCILYKDQNKVIVSYRRGDYIVNYSSSRAGKNIINSNVGIYKEDTQKRGHQKIVSTFKLNKENQDSYKLSVHKDVINEANKLKRYTDIDLIQWDEITEVFRMFLVDFTENERALFFSEIGESATYHFSIYNVSKRNTINSLDCRCTPSPLYFTGKTPFVCQEDVSYNISEQKNSLQHAKDFFIEKYGVEVVAEVEDYLNSKELDNISMVEVFYDIHGGSSNDFDIALEGLNCWLGLGTSLGCCGNYSGCCWFRSQACLMHDIQCLDCSPCWYCGFQCEPGI